MYRVFLVDDRTLARAALRSLLSSTGRVTVVAEADSLADAHGKLATGLPDAAVADYTAVTTAELADTPLASRLLLLNVSPLASVTAFNGAAGWLARQATVEELVTAITTVASGGRHVSASLSTQPSASDGGVLSRREHEVLRALAAGRTNREIAADLGISVKTIDTHRGHVLKKLGLRNNSDLTRFAISSGLLPP